MCVSYVCVCVCVWGGGGGGTIHGGHLRGKGLYTEVVRMECQGVYRRVCGGEAGCRVVSMHGGGGGGLPMGRGRVWGRGGISMGFKVYGKSTLGSEEKKRDKSSL